MLTPKVHEDPLHKLEHRVTKDTFLIGIERIDAMRAAVVGESKADTADAEPRR